MSTTGYRVKVRGEVVGTFWCQDCASKTCGCLFLALAQARAFRRNAEVCGEHDGNEVLLAHLHVPGAADAAFARESARWDEREKAGEKRPRLTRRKAA